METSSASLLRLLAVKLVLFLSFKGTLVKWSSFIVDTQQHGGGRGVVVASCESLLSRLQEKHGDVVYDVLELLAISLFDSSIDGMDGRLVALDGVVDCFDCCRQWRTGSYSFKQQ